ncbi:MAG: tetraacyldisaccharide 4'-kinase [Parachlamydiaceae bacterium]|nr:tetraacyldisaccharide 4'-kinase [Parachlamydiaceae bacterium]
MLRHLESYFLDVIKGKKNGLLASLLRGGLHVLSWPFQFIVTCRNWIFDRGWVCRYYPPVPVVISVGNIVVGGTGKTPVTLMLAQEFYNDFSLAVLSRGYRSPAEKLSDPMMLSKGNGPMQSAALCGDESFLLSQNLPKAFVIVGRNRHKASNMAAKAGAQVILLDDGMQHRRLARDFEVVVMDAGDLYGQGYFLPRGLLREGVKSLARADLIIINHVADANAFADMKVEVQRNSAALVIGTRMEVVDVLDFEGMLISNLQGIKVGIFCGIAHPEYFHNTVSQLGATIVSTLYTADHDSFETEMLKAFAKECLEKGAEMILCTEKDRVKLVDIKGVVLPVAWIKMRLKVIEGNNEWRTFIDRAKAILKASAI